MATINALLTWIGRGFGIHHLTLQLLIGYIFYPVTFFLGVPRSEILPVAQLLATKLVANEFAAYLGKHFAFPPPSTAFHRSVHRPSRNHEGVSPIVASSAHNRDIRPMRIRKPRRVRHSSRSAECIGTIPSTPYREDCNVGNAMWLPIHDADCWYCVS